MATFAEWVEGARPRTLPAAIAPVIAGTGSAYSLGHGRPMLAVLALLVALALQVGVNYANDYSDGVRGTDHVRVGPVRLVGQQLAPPTTVRTAAFVAFGVAAACGLALTVLSETWWLIPLGVAAIFAAWYYTGGRRPYGYAGLGELFVFVFFGLVAVLGTTYSQVHRLDAASGAAAVGVGSIACALLVANNLRDIPGDASSGKRTLAVRLGDGRTRLLYLALLAVALLAVVVAAVSHPAAAVALLAFARVAPLVRRVRSGAVGRDLIAVLGMTGRFELAYSLLLGLGLAISSHLG